MMPPPALPHSETVAGPEPYHSPHEVGVAGPANADPLQQFIPEAPQLLVRPKAVVRHPVADDLRIEGPNPPRAALPRSWDFRLTTWPLRSLLLGAALGAVAMWLLGMQPGLFGRLGQSATSTEASTPTPAAVASANPSSRDVNLPPEPARAAAGLTDPADTPATPSHVAAGVSPAGILRAHAAGSPSSQVASAAPTRPAQIANAPAAPVRPGAFRGSIVVRSEPPGARVFVRGQQVGVTPVVLSDVPIGSRAVRIEADGYDVWSAAVRVIANQQTQVAARLDRANPAPRP